MLVDGGGTGADFAVAIGFGAAAAGCGAVAAGFAGGGMATFAAGGGPAAGGACAAFASGELPDSFTLLVAASGFVDAIISCLIPQAAASLGRSKKVVWGVGAILLVAAAVLGEPLAGVGSGCS